MEGVGMEQAGGETVGWFDGLPWQMWVGVVVAIVTIVALVYWAWFLDQPEEYVVRGWGERGKETVAEDEWWAREYPLADEVMWEDGHG